MIVTPGKPCKALDVEIVMKNGERFNATVSDDLLQSITQKGVLMVKLQRKPAKFVRLYKDEIASATVLAVLEH